MSTEDDVDRALVAEAVLPTFRMNIRELETVIEKCQSRLAQLRAENAQGDDDIDVLRLWREREPVLRARWSGEDPAEWSGVTIDGDRVKELILDMSFTRNKLTSLPAEFGQLTSLRELNLRGNQLTSLPAEIWQLTSLTRLRLGNNQLTSVLAEIGKLTSLRDLTLSNNRLRILPVEIGDLTSLERLDLRSNQLQFLSLRVNGAAFIHCFNIEYLVILNSKTSRTP